MQLEFEMSGGYGGLFATKPLSIRVNTDELADKGQTELIELIELIEASKLRNLTREDIAPPNPGVRDAFQYRLTLINAGERRQLAFDDSNLPAALRPLVETLKRLALERGGAAN